MSKRIKELFLFDILIAVLKIEEHAKRYKSAYQLKLAYHDWDFIIRQFEIIGESTNKLIKYSYFSDDKREIVDFRNVLIHEYFGIDHEEVWDIIKNHLPKFKNEILAKINELDYELKERLINSLLKEYMHIPFVSDALIALK